MNTQYLRLLEILYVIIRATPFAPFKMLIYAPLKAHLCASIIFIFTSFSSFKYIFLIQNQLYLKYQNFPILFIFYFRFQILLD